MMTLPTEPNSPSHTTVCVEYYALFREQAGVSSETIALSDVHKDAVTCMALWEYLQTKYGFTLAASRCRVAVNDEFCLWEHVISSGDRIVFIPPVAGG